jgi:hypothetical protein
MIWVFVLGIVGVGFAYVKVRRQRKASNGSLTR